MPVALVVSWAATGALAGVFVRIWTRRQLDGDRAGLLTAQPTAPLLTAILFGVLAWRLGGTFDLLAYSYLAAIGVSLGIIDLIEQRLPTKLVLPGFAVIGAAFTALAIVNSAGMDLLRAAAGSVAVAGFYLVLALASGGGLGAGDVKLGGLLGLALGWLSWSAVLAGVLLGWCFGGIAWLILRMTGLRPRTYLLPAGPPLLLGAFVAIGLMPSA
jgi:leader peptidase (prepilin peptidase) / N-methyltransferase